MSAPTITRREAIKAGSDHLVLLLLAVLAAGVPQIHPQPSDAALPDWLRDTPPWMLPKLERIVAASQHIGFDGYPGATLEGFFETTARMFETAAKPRDDGEEDDA